MNSRTNFPRNSKPPARAVRRALFSQQDYGQHLFEVSDGSFSHYAAVNPLQGWHHILNGNFRYDLSGFFGGGDRIGIAAVAHANNLTNQLIWFPSGFSSVDTVPVQQGRDIFAGLEFSFGKN